MNRVISHRAASTSLSVCYCSAAAGLSFRSRSARRTIRTSSPPPLAQTPPKRSSLVVAAAGSSNDPTSPSPSPSLSSSKEELSDDVWAMKPIWCRPYSIVTTGVFVVAGAEVVGGRWLAFAAAAAIAVWWWAFLVEYPAAYRDYVRGTKTAGGFAERSTADSEEF